MSRTFRITLPAQEFEVERESCERLAPSDLPIKYEVLEIPKKAVHCVYVEEVRRYHVHVGAASVAAITDLEFDDLDELLTNAGRDEWERDIYVTDVQIPKHPDLLTPDLEV